MRTISESSARGLRLALLTCCLLTHRHPMEQSNQKKVWIAEQKWEEQQKRDAEANAQLKRELDMWVSLKEGGTLLVMMPT